MVTERPRLSVRRAQALIELALGLLALVILISAVCGFAVYIAKSLKVQNSQRASWRVKGGDVKVDIQVGEYTIRTLKVDERVNLPVFVR